MRNKILEKVIDEVVDQSDESKEFKTALKAYVKNKFDGNATENDLKTVLTLVKEEETL